VAGLTPSGERVWASSTHPDVLGGMIEEEFCGRPARVDGEGIVQYA
jgi:hypothetical protein